MTNQPRPLTGVDRPILSQLLQRSILDRITEDNYQFQVPLVQKFVESVVFNHR
jgi:hypothetical protein